MFLVPNLVELATLDHRSSKAAATADRDALVLSLTTRRLGE
jgi:hypothetical protein